MLQAETMQHHLAKRLQRPLKSAAIEYLRLRYMTPKSDALSFTKFHLQRLFGLLANVGIGTSADDQ